jgi:predicted PurR-regulated permease PerM
MDIAIRIGVLALWLTWCFWITRPFLTAITWGIVIAIAIHPLHKRLSVMLGGRRKVSAFLITLAMLLLLVGPAVLLASVLVDNVHALVEQMREGKLAIPPPPKSVHEWPLIGQPLTKIWDLAAVNLGEALQQLGPQIKAVGTWLLEAVAGTGIGLLEFVVAVIIAGVLLVHAGGGHRVAHGIGRRLAGEKGSDLATLAEVTVRGVARGILGVALIQSLLAGLGLVMAGVPLAGLWALACLVLSVVQIGVGPVMIPAVIYVFATGSTLTAVLFLVWAGVVSISDNVLKPLLMGRGVNVPMAVIFVGAIGGMVMSGIIGLFVGAVILALGYRLFMGWLDMGRVEIDGSAVKL